MDPITQYSNDDTSFLGYTPHFQPALASAQAYVPTSTSNYRYPTEAQAYANTHWSQFQPQTDQWQYQRTSRIFSEPVLSYNTQNSFHTPQVTPSQHRRTFSLGTNSRYFGRSSTDEQTPTPASCNPGLSQTQYHEAFGVDPPPIHVGLNGLEGTGRPISFPIPDQYLAPPDQEQQHSNGSQLQDTPFNEFDAFSQEVTGGYQVAHHPTGSTMQGLNQQFDGLAEISNESLFLDVIPENQTMGQEQNAAYMHLVPLNDGLATWPELHVLQEQTQLCDQMTPIQAPNTASPLYTQCRQLHPGINAPYNHRLLVDPRQTAESSGPLVPNRTQSSPDGYNRHQTVPHQTLRADTLCRDQQVRVSYKDVGVQTQSERYQHAGRHTTKKAGGREEATRPTTTGDEQTKHILAAPTSLNQLPPGPKDSSQTRRNSRLAQSVLYPRMDSGSRPPCSASKRHSPSADIISGVPLSGGYHASQSFRSSHRPVPQNRQDHQTLIGLGEIPQRSSSVTRDAVPAHPALQVPSIAISTPCELPARLVQQGFDELIPAPREPTSPVSNEQIPCLSGQLDSKTSHLGPVRRVPIGYLPTPNPTPDGSLDKPLCYPPSSLGNMAITQAPIPRTPEGSNQCHIKGSATCQAGAQLQEGVCVHTGVSGILVHRAEDTIPSLGVTQGQNRTQPRHSSERDQSRFQESSGSGTTYQSAQPLQSSAQEHPNLTVCRLTAQSQQRSSLQCNPRTQTTQSYAESKPGSTSTDFQLNVPKVDQVHLEPAERGGRWQARTLGSKRERSACET
ncbi:hypothetical protein FRC12_009121 [Ceratobasidium sp. 428]|nr:hypothetical protein FRC12_009121 [Ceratobasidium sp. 428]